MNLRSFFVDHPARVGESYFQHMRTALGFARSLLGAGFAVAIHSVFPALFERTASGVVDELHRRMASRRNQP